MVRGHNANLGTGIVKLPIIINVMSMFVERILMGIWNVLFRCPVMLPAAGGPRGPKIQQLGAQMRVAYPRARVDPYLDLLKPSQKLG